MNSRFAAAMLQIPESPQSKKFQHALYASVYIIHSIIHTTGKSTYSWYNMLILPALFTLYFT